MWLDIHPIAWWVGIVSRDIAARARLCKISNNAGKPHLPGRLAHAYDELIQRVDGCYIR